MLNDTAEDKVDIDANAMGADQLARLDSRLLGDEIYACDARYQQHARWRR